MENLIREWNFHTRGGKNERALADIGPLHVYLGWTEHELAQWRMEQACPTEDPVRAPRHLRSVR